MKVDHGDKLTAGMTESRPQSTFISKVTGCVVQKDMKHCVNELYAYIIYPDQYPDRVITCIQIHALQWQTVMRINELMNVYNYFFR